MVPRQTGTGCDVCVRLQSAAALCVGVGSFSDPSDLPGLAHFLEHSEYKKRKRGERIRSLLLFGQRLMFPSDSPVVFHLPSSHVQFSSRLEAEITHQTSAFMSV